MVKISKTSELARWRGRLSGILATLSESTQRTALFAERITDLDTPVTLPFFRGLLLDNFGVRDPSSRLLTEAVMMALLDERWPQAHRSGALKWAVRKGDRLVSIFLGHVGPENDCGDHAFEVPNYSEERPLTLGERRSLASTPSRTVIALALRDPHPMVIEKLLDNPKLTEKDAVFLSSRRPAPFAALEKVAIHPKFRSCRPVARALVQNPHLPVSVALTLLPGLDIPTIKALAKDPKITPLLNEASREIISALEIPGNGNQTEN